MNLTFLIAEVYRPPQRSGPILVGTSEAGQVTVGTRLALPDDPAQAVEVVAVDLPTVESEQAGRIAVVVAPDLGVLLSPGTELEIDNSRARPYGAPSD